MDNIKLLALLNDQKTMVNSSEIQYRVYYDENGKVITYTTEKLDGNYLIISKEQYAEARNDVIIKDDQLIYTHRKSHIFKLVKNLSDGVKASKYDINILDSDDFNYWKITSYEIS